MKIVPGGNWAIIGSAVHPYTIKYKFYNCYMLLLYSARHEVGTCTRPRILKQTPLHS